MEYNNSTALNLTQEKCRTRDKENSGISAILQIERALSQLSPKELARFREWFEKFDAKIWDKQFDQDAKSGKLGKRANQAIADFRVGKYKEL